MRVKIQDKTRQNVWMKYGKRCAYCGKLIEERDTSIIKKKTKEKAEKTIDKDFSL